jgi:hypothetical protein
MANGLCAECSEICQTSDAQGSSPRNTGGACLYYAPVPPTQACAFDQTEARSFVVSQFENNCT